MGAKFIETFEQRMFTSGAQNNMRSTCAQSQLPSNSSGAGSDFQWSSSRCNRAKPVSTGLLKRAGLQRFGTSFAHISRDSLMVRCRAHNPETVNACVGSNPTPATNENF